jgi:hypothetical protein
VETTQATFDGWAIVDVLGHQRYVGYVTTEAYGQAVLFRIDVPALEERERTTKRPGYVESRYLPAGTVVTEGAVAGYTKLIGAGSIYAITPCTKEAALAAVEDTQARPLMSVQLPPETPMREGIWDPNDADDLVDCEVDEDVDDDEGEEVKDMAEETKDGTDAPETSGSTEAPTSAPADTAPEGGATQESEATA